MNKTKDRVIFAITFALLFGATMLVEVLAGQKPQPDVAAIIIMGLMLREEIRE